jgi:hypothetical protein
MGMATAAGCSSGDNGAPAPVEAGVSSSGGSSSGGSDSGSTCADAGPSVATLDAGNATWACLETQCASALATCATDCMCNQAFLTALGCTAGGGSAITCFTTAATTGGANAITVGTCLQTKSASCGGPTPEAGTEGGTPEGGSSGGEGGPSGDGGGDAASASDAPTGG